MTSFVHPTELATEIDLSPCDDQCFHLNVAIVENIP